MAEPKRLVLKFGTHLLRAADGGVDAKRIQHYAAEVADLRRQAHPVVLVSSGAVGLGMARIGRERRPRRLETLQACAAIGQTILMQTWQEGFEPHGLAAAQVLLTREDVRARDRHVAILRTFEQLLTLGVIPIVNENDAVSAEEIKFGDNDILSALVASLLKAQLLVILSTAPGLLNRGSGKLLPVVPAITAEVEALAGGTDNPAAVGGMRSKIEAAKVATRSGCGVFITSGEQERPIIRAVAGEAPGTLFVPRAGELQSKKRWLAFFGRVSGTIRVDAGAERALREQGRSLLAKGVTGHAGNFAAGDLIEVAGGSGAAFARGVTRYAAEELAAVAGLSSSEIRQRHPARTHPEVVHRDGLVLLG